MMRMMASSNRRRYGERGNHGCRNLWLTLYAKTKGVRSFHWVQILNSCLAPKAISLEKETVTFFTLSYWGFTSKQKKWGCP